MIELGENYLSSIGCTKKMIKRSIAVENDNRKPRSNLTFKPLKIIGSKWSDLATVTALNTPLKKVSPNENVF